MADQSKEQDFLQEWENLIHQEEAAHGDNTNRQIERKGESGAPLVDRPTPGTVGGTAHDVISSADMLKVLAEQQGLEMAKIGDFKVDLKLLSYLTADVARDYRAFPLQFDEEKNVIIAISDPLNLAVLDSLRLMFDNPIKPVRIDIKLIHITGDECNVVEIFISCTLFDMFAL